MKHLRAAAEFAAIVLALTVALLVGATILATVDPLRGDQPIYRGNA
jgi:hypothetical protein